MTPFITLVMVFMMAGCATLDPVVIDSDYQDRWEQWKTQLNQNRIKYVQLFGLVKINPGINQIGAGTSNEIQLPYPGMPDYLGTLTFDGETMAFASNPDLEVTLEDQAVQSLDLSFDSKGYSQTLHYKSFNWFINKRKDGHYFRIRDQKNPSVDNFQGFDFYSASSKWIIKAYYHTFNPIKIEKVPNVLGTTLALKFVGYYTFEVNGQSYQLDALEGGFIMFSDLTNGQSTYEWRYMYLDPQVKPLYLDFNTSYNPPCSYSKFTTCDKPPQQNKLPLSIEAGEKYH